MNMRNAWSVFALLVMASMASKFGDNRMVLADDNVVNHIFGGTVIDANEFTFFTAITGRTGNFRCSGVLVGHRFVATAAHCVRESSGVTAEDIFVDVAYYCVRRDNCGRPHEVIAVEQISVDDSVTDKVSDFALLTLEKAPSLRPEFLSPVRMDLDGTVLKTLRKKTRMILVGGGKSNEAVRAPSDFVTQLTVQYIPRKKCKKSGLSRSLYGFICSVPQKGTRTGPCRGDSGGPVMVQNKDGEWLLLAIHSFGKRVCGSKRVKPDGHFTVKAATSLIRSVICDGPYLPEDWCNDNDKNLQGAPTAAPDLLPTSSNLPTLSPTKSPLKAPAPNDDDNNNNNSSNGNPIFDPPEIPTFDPPEIPTFDPPEIPTFDPPEIPTFDPPEIPDFRPFP